ncbi:hypothetical protein [Nocardia puris]|uniref:hypothetical protein n=1 Tax=Nocardia puris TaxID=208602 RepID=UPI002E1E8C0A
MPTPVSARSERADDADHDLDCSECGAPTVSDRRTVDELILCADCAEDWYRCGDCGRFDSFTITTAGGDEVCDSCASAYTYCLDCDCPAEDTVGVDGGDEVCTSCLRHGYHECQHCDTYIRDGENYCGHCEATQYSDDIFDSFYRPSPVFHGSGPLYLGLELEVRLPHGVDRAAATAVEHLGGLGYLKHDGSISCGFELVTHPMSFPWAIEHFPWSLLARLRLLGAYTDDEVGIHVHLSRDGFDGPSHVYRWMKFVYRNQQSVTVLARRDAPYWAAFDEGARAEIASYAKGSPSTHGRYQAINVCSEPTYELRVFASSLDTREVQAALGFAAASAEYTRALTAADIARGGWEWDPFVAWLRVRPAYAALLAELDRLGIAGTPADSEGEGLACAS